MLVVTVAGLVTGLAAGLDPVAILSAFGKAFVADRFVGIVWLVLPVIGVLERSGLRERAQGFIGRVQAATTGRLLLAYLLVRQSTCAPGLTSLGGQAQMVRPLIAPMAEAAEGRHGPMPDARRDGARAPAHPRHGEGRGALDRERLPGELGKVKAEAGIVGLTFHDLRGTAVLMLNMAGATEAEIATITGHSLRDVRSILDKHYFYRDTRLGDSGIDKVDAMIATMVTPANDVMIGAARRERQPNGLTGSKRANVGRK